MVSIAKLAINARASLLASFIARLSVALVQELWIKTLLKMIVNLLFLMACPNFTAESDRRPAFSLSPMLPTLRPDLNEHLYLRDLHATALGRRLLTESVRLLDEIDLEVFTFKSKTLALRSTEASLYRYFENKHRLLTYLVSWHWAWMRFRVSFTMTNVVAPRQRLHLALVTVCAPTSDPPATLDLNKEVLYRVVMAEAREAYLTKEVDADNQAGLFREYKPSGQPGGASHESQLCLPSRPGDHAAGDGPQTVIFRPASAFAYQRG